MDAADAEASLPPLPWTVPGYRHERDLGSGGSGSVVLARHQATGTPVAIKYLVRSLHAEPDFRLAYRNEAVLLGALRSEHVARLYEYVESEQGAAIVMEAVEGVSLRALLRAEGAAGPEAALVILKGSLLGLAAAHEAGVVHRDYKPDNVLVTPAGASKLVDFGIAARSGDAGAAAGTPLYMAPEQFYGRPATPAADVYAATATFFECVTGDKPYPGTTVVELMAQHIDAPIPDALAPEAVRGLIRAGLAKLPEDRPQSAAAFVAALEDAAGAAYGPDWEERGQRKLAALAALLPLLLLESSPAILTGATALAETDLGMGDAGAGAAAGARAGMRGARARFGRAAIGIGALLLVAGGVVAVANAADGGGGNGPTVSAADHATVGATTLVAPGPTASMSPDLLPPAAGASAGASPTATPTLSAAAAATASSSPSSQPSSSPTPTLTSTATATVSASPSPVLKVRSVSITSLTCSGNSGAQAAVAVTSNGAAPGALNLTWFYIDPLNGAQVQAAPVSVALPQGKTSFSGTYTHNFEKVGTSWGLTVSTDPAAASGNGSSKSIVASLCEIQ
jgi:hypothetical protein